MLHAHQDQLSGLTDDDLGRISSAEKGKQHRIRSMAVFAAEIRAGALGLDSRTGGDSLNPVTADARQRNLTSTGGRGLSGAEPKSGAEP